MGGGAIDPPPLAAGLPYIHGTSEWVAKGFIRYNIHLAHKPILTLKRELCHVKDKRTRENKAGVHKFGCKACDVVYK